MDLHVLVKRSRLFFLLSEIKLVLGSYFFLNRDSVISFLKKFNLQIIDDSPVFKSLQEKVIQTPPDISAVPLPSQDDETSQFPIEVSCPSEKAKVISTVTLIPSQDDKIHQFVTNDLRPSEKLVPKLCNIVKRLSLDPLKELSLEMFRDTSKMRSCFTSASTYRKFCGELSEMFHQLNYFEMATLYSKVYSSFRKNVGTNLGYSISGATSNRITALEGKALTAMARLRVEMGRSIDFKVYRNNNSNDYVLVVNWLAALCAAKIGHVNCSNLLLGNFPFDQTFVYNKDRVNLPLATRDHLKLFHGIRSLIASPSQFLFLASNGKPLKSEYSSSTLKRFC